MEKAENANEQFNSAASGSWVNWPAWIIAILALGLLLHSATVIFLWLASSFLLFALVDPWVQKLQKRGASFPLVKRGDVRVQASSANAPIWVESGKLFLTTLHPEANRSNASPWHRHLISLIS